MRKALFILFFIFWFVPIFTVQAGSPIKILLVPGHDDQAWGAQYGNMKEANMTLSLATRIYNILKLDKRFEVHITRDQNGYTKEFADYFNNNKADILAFEQNDKQQMQNNIANGSFVQKKNAPHHTVSSDIAMKLYGFNKWADDNKIDAVVHIHFNDHIRSNKWVIGPYKGFVIYMPDSQLVNSQPSVNLAKSIFTQLHKKYSTSNYYSEAGGLIPDQKLIAMGANGTLDATVRSVLIEYGYIYEKRFRASSTRLAAYDDMAKRTATGIQNYFFPN